MKINQTTTVECDKLILVPYKKEHVLKYHNWMKSEELQELTASEPLSLEDEYRMQQSWAVDEDKCTFIILDAKTFAETKSEIDAMAGDVNLFLNDPENRHTAEIEIMIAEKSLQGKGLGKQALAAMLIYGAKKIHLNTFTAKIGFDNEKSLGLFQKFGFKEVSRAECFREVTLELAVTEEVMARLTQHCPDLKIAESEAE